MSEFKVGDVVRLKSGGPSMTVTSLPKEDGDIECVWFCASFSAFSAAINDGNTYGAQMFDEFPPDALEAVSK